MHEYPIGWDLISLWKLMGWNDKFFALYLALVVGFSFFRSLRLGRRLWRYFPAIRSGPRDAKPEASDLLAARALANKLFVTNCLSDESDFFPAKSEGSEQRSQIVESAAPQFKYLWHSSAAKVAGMKSLAVLTIILSALVLSYDLMRSIAIWPIRSCGDCAGGPADMLVPFVLGLAVSAALYALSTFFASVLARRRAEWDLFVANVTDQYNVK